MGFVPTGHRPIKSRHFYQAGDNIPFYMEKTTDLSQVTDKLYHIPQSALHSTWRTEDAFLEKKIKRLNKYRKKQTMHQILLRDLKFLLDQSKADIFIKPGIIFHFTWRKPPTCRKSLTNFIT
jgi:hypothetical protein